MARLNGFTKKQLMDVYGLMVSARELDTKMLILLKQGKGFFHMGLILIIEMVRIHLHSE